MRRTVRLLGMLAVTVLAGVLINADPTEVLAIDEDPGGGCPKTKCVNVNNCGPSPSNSMCVYLMDEQTGRMDCVGQALCT